MELKEIKKFISTVIKSKVSEVKVKTEKFKIKIKTEDTQVMFSIRINHRKVIFISICLRLLKY